MKLYEINKAIAEITDQIEFDEETGEIFCDMESINAQLAELDMEKKRVLEYLAKIYFNEMADASALKEEADRLTAKRKRTESRANKLLQILDRECGGVKTDLGVATVTYRKSQSLNIYDQSRVVNWLQDSGHEEMLRYKKPEIDKAAVKKLIKTEGEIPGAEIEDKLNCSLK